ncbi:hypothetical protein AB7M26_004172 [Pseudomonas sp. F-14 TE3482]
MPLLCELCSGVVTGFNPIYRANRSACLPMYAESLSLSH